MIKKVGVACLICCFFLAALPNVAPAAASLSRKSLIKNNIAVLQNQLLAGASDDSMPLIAMTVQFLEDVKLLGFKENTADLELAVEQYVGDMEEQVEAAALDPACVTPLAYSIYTNGSSMLDTIASGGEPVCISIRLSMQASSIIAAKNSFDVCAGNKTSEEVAPAQNAIKYYRFIASVLDVAICNPSAGVQTYINLLYNFVMLFLFQ